MIKTSVIVLAGVVLIISLVNLLPYIFYYKVLADYGKGYVWGNILLLSLAAFCMYALLKKKKSK